MLSWLSANTDEALHWSQYILEAVVAISVFGESLHYLPKGRLPLYLQNDDVLLKIAKRSWVVLVLALALEVPVGMARGSIAAGREAQIARANRPSRVLTDGEEADRLVALFRKLPANEYAVTVDSADRNPNSEQALFGAQLRLMLDGAGWKQSKIPSLQRIWAPNLNKGVLISFRSDSDYSKRVFKELAEDLALFGIASFEDPLSDLDEHTFWFEIGTK